MNISLKDIGLNEYEARVYLALVRIGKSGTTEISRESGVPFGRVYDVLDSLIKKKLVKEIPEKPKRYYAEDISYLDELIESKISKLKGLKNELKKIKSKIVLPKDPVCVTKGKKTFHKIVLEMKPEKYSYGIRYNFLYHPVWVRETKRDKKRGIEIKSMGPFNERTKENIKKWSRIIEIKEFPNEGATISIDDDRHTFISLLNQDMHIMINDDAFTKVMAELFRRAWKVSKKIEI